MSFYPARAAAQSYIRNEDAAGQKVCGIRRNVTQDGMHSYTYDAEGNVIHMDGMSYFYDALNRRVRIDLPTESLEYAYNLAGQHVSVCDTNSGAQIQGQYYWNNRPLAFYSGGAIHFQHQDVLGTERVRTTYNGATEGIFTSLPFGDASATTGTDNDPYHFAALDHDTESGTDHAQFRQYSPTQGRWMSPDPYGGSYDFSDPQSFNRYGYVSNNPLGFIDPSGLQQPRMSKDLGGGGGDGLSLTVITGQGFTFGQSWGINIGKL